MTFLEKMKIKLNNFSKSRQLLLLDVLDFLVDKGNMNIWTCISSKKFFQSLLDLLKNFIFSISISLKISLWRFGNPTLMNDNCLFIIDLKILFSLIEKSLIFNSSLFENLIKTFLQVLFAWRIMICFPGIIFAISRE